MGQMDSKLKQLSKENDVLKTKNDSLSIKNTKLQ